MAAAIEWCPVTVRGRPDARPATPTQGHSGTKTIALVPIVK
jgi:hypothetical protein